MAASPLSLFGRLFGLVSSLVQPPVPAQDALQRQLDALNAQFDSSVTRLALGLSEGRVSLGQFTGAMQTAIRQHHLAAAVIASGGVDGATPQTLVEAQAAVDRQLAYFNAWNTQLAERAQAGQLPSAAYIANRARLYGKAATETASRSNVQARGLPTLTQYPRDGQTRCLMNCNCTLRVVPLDVVNGSYNIFWTLHPGESCVDCRRMSRQWNPLRIRRGRIVG